MHNNGVNIIQWVTLGISFFAGSAWFAPYVYDKMSKPIIKGKIMGHYMMTKGKVELVNPISDIKKVTCGNIFWIRMSLISLQNNFNLNKVKINMKFKSDSKIYEGHTYFLEKMTSITKENMPTGFKETKYEFIMQQQSNIIFCPVLLKNQSCEKDFMFIVESNLTDIEYIELFFYANKDEKRSQKIKVCERDYEGVINLFDYVEKKEI